MEQTGLELINVTKKFQNAGSENFALKDLTLKIKPGEYVGLMGMNGSGKSTLVRLCNGLLKPTAGQVFVNGLDTGCPENLAPIRRLVGMVFQNPDNQLLCPVVEEEIAFGPENLDLTLPEIKRRIDEALQALGLAELRYHAPHLLSGGQKQKVALASVLAMQPQYLILDEPTSMLDPLSRRELLEHLRSLNRQKGITIVLSSHNPEDLIDTDRIIVLEQGSIYLEGTPAQVFAQSPELAAVGLDTPGLFKLIRLLGGKEGHPIASQVKSITELINKLCQQSQRDQPGQPNRPSQQCQP